VAENKKQVVLEINRKKMRMRARAEKSLNRAAQCGRVDAGRLRRGSCPWCILTRPFCILGCLLLSGIQPTRQVKQSAGIYRPRRRERVTTKDTKSTKTDFEVLSIQRFVV
jgi:hypothetical protein